MCSTRNSSKEVAKFKPSSINGYDKISDKTEYRLNKKAFQSNAIGLLADWNSYMMNNELMPCKQRDQGLGLHCIVERNDSDSI